MTRIENILSCFNSIKVRLRLVDKNCPAVFCNTFQFHKGTIKTVFVFVVVVVTMMFQFHKGTIKTSGGDGIL